MISLVLFDVDGTLLLTPDRVYLEALAATVAEVWDHQLTEESFARADHRPGETATAGLRNLLLGEGLERALIDAELGRWCGRFSRRYVELLARARTDHWDRAPGAEGALAELERAHDLALLTGNPEPVARTRIERLGLARFFPPGRGAFGCEADDQADLIALARRRAGGVAAARTVLVGDTPLDVEGARRAGVKVVGVTLGAYGRETLAAADAVVDGLLQVPAALRALEAGAA